MGQHVEADRARQVALAMAVDLGDEIVEGAGLGLGDGTQRLPEGGLEGDAGLMAGERDRVFFEGPGHLESF